MRWKRSASAAVVLAAALAASACGGGSAGGGGDKKPSGACSDVPFPKAKDQAQLKAPTSTLDPAKTYKVVIETNCGAFTITLDQQTSPKTAASFVSLAEDGYFDDTFFHRIAPGFVIQGGDPTGKGTGGPGYTTIEAPPAGAAYVRYVVAMAKTSAQPPGAAGSQFFIVTAADAQLPPEYALLGKVTEGMSVVNRIGKLGDPTTQDPTRAVVIDTMTVEES
ncbi:MAG: peptidylprolyl isomerase [Actinobacteria bacterium]|nr:peptidylprolyl isomerase [Actinomycetota bacterium]